MTIEKSAVRFSTLVDQGKSCGNFPMHTVLIHFEQMRSVVHGFFVNLLI